MLRVSRPAAPRGVEPAPGGAPDRVVAVTRRLAAAVGLLFVFGASLLVWAMLRHEASEAQQHLERELTEVAQALRAGLLRDAQSLQLALAQPGRLDPGGADDPVAAFVAQRPELIVIEWLDARGETARARTSPLARLAAAAVARAPRAHESSVARAAAWHADAATFSSAYFTPLPDGGGFEAIDLWLPPGAGAPHGLRVVYALAELLAERLPHAFVRGHEIVLTDVDGSSLARRDRYGRGLGAYRARALLTLPGATFVLQADSLRAAPRLLPNLLTGLVIGLAAALLAALARLVGDVQRRARAEAALREAYALRQAMEDSLVTGLRARDLHGRITYVNPAFCEMVGFEAAELVGRAPPMPYWAPEAIDEYRQRHAQVLAGTVTRQGHESVWMRRGGERFPVLIHEAALIDADGRHTGWMSSVVDLTEQRRAEELVRQQSEKLQQAARMATMGELATVLSHELNQPLAAISSYATGAANLLAAGTGAGTTPATAAGGGHDAVGASLREALDRIAAQAQRAGRIVRRVNDFMRRRPVRLEPVDAVETVAALQPLFELQARKAAARLELALPAEPAPVLADRVMLEQLLLNLARNGIEAMGATEPARRVLEVRVAPADGARVRIEVADRGSGIDPALGEQVFAPFFTTKPDGLGMGLSLCRSVAEQGGGRLWHKARDGGGTLFVLQLPRIAP